jgi:hypothetical protein
MRNLTGLTENREAASKVLFLSPLRRQGANLPAVRQGFENRLLFFASSRLCGDFLLLKQPHGNKETKILSSGKNINPHLDIIGYRANQRVSLNSCRRLQ